MTAITLNAGAVPRARAAREPRGRDDRRDDRRDNRRAAPGGGAVRLTRRGRVVALLLLLSLAVSVLALVRAPAVATTEAGSAPVAERVTVQPGETLWGIAERTVPQADPRVTVARIMQMNQLGSSMVPAGRVLLVPAGG